MLKHKAGDWVLYTQDKKYWKVLAVRNFRDHYDDQEWLNMGAPAQEMYSLRLTCGRTLADNVNTEWHTADELTRHYPIADAKAIEVLYGKKEA